jgi:hypothetical protein
MKKTLKIKYEGQLIGTRQTSRDYKFALIMRYTEKGIKTRFVELTERINSLKKYLEKTLPQCEKDYVNDILQSDIEDLEALKKGINNWKLLACSSGTNTLNQEISRRNKFQAEDVQFVITTEIE